MKSAALGIGYVIWCRHRTGFIAAAAGLAAWAIACHVMFAYARSLEAVVASTIPLIVIFSFILNACLFAEDPGSMVSSYPRSLFVLPTRSAALAFWPMFYGSSIAALTWIFVAGLIYGSNGFDLPVWLPALALAALMAWLEGLAWMPLAAQWLRLLVVITTVSALGALPLWLLWSGWGTSPVLVTLFSAYISSAFLVGLASVATDRRGGSWLLSPASFRFGQRAADRVTVPNLPPFRSAASAQLWFERKCHGLVMPAYFGMTFCGIWTMTLAVQRAPYPPLHFALILGILVAIPIVMAGAIGPAMGLFRPFWIRNRGFITFVAVRPMTSWQMLVAKLRMVIASVILSGAFVVIGTMLWIVASDNLSNAAGLNRDFAVRYPGGRSLAILAIAAVLLPALVAKQSTDGFANVLTGRRWIADGAAWIYATGLVILCSTGLWLGNHPQALARLYAAMPWLVPGFAIVKGTLAFAVFRAVLDRRLLDWSAVWSILAVWLTITGLAVVLAILALPPDAIPVSKPALILGIASFVPLIRFPLATLALEWNRHR